MAEGMIFARQMLQEHGEFYPFAVARTSDGNVVHVGATTDDEWSPPSDVLRVLEDGLRASAAEGSYAATAVFVDMLVTPPGATAKTDAILVSLEHVTGYAVDVWFPYARPGGSSLHIGEAFASARVATVFT